MLSHRPTNRVCPYTTLFRSRTDEERQELLKGTFAGLGRQLGLFSKFASDRRETLLDITRWEGLEHLESARATKQIGRAPRRNSSHLVISYAVFCLKE